MSDVQHEYLIRQALDGKQIQWFNDAYAEATLRSWLTLKTPREAIHSLVAFPDRQYRVKPEPVVRWFSVYRETSHLKAGFAGDFNDRKAAVEFPHTEKVMRLEIDADTLTVISCKTEIP